MAKLITMDRSLYQTKAFTQMTHGEKMVLCENLKRQYPGTVPVIIKTTLELNNYKYLAKNSMTVAALTLDIRGRNPKIITPTVSLHILHNDTVLLPTATLGDLHTKYKDRDGFLYLIITQENTFG